MEIQVGELRDLMHMISDEISETINNYKGFSKRSTQEHEMECERNWEEGYDKGFQDGKNEIKDEAKKKAISNQKPLEEDLSPAITIDSITELRLNENFKVPSRCFGHHGLLYKLSEEEWKKACKFVDNQYAKYPLDKISTFSYITHSDGIGVAVTIKNDVRGDELDITDYSRW